MGCSKIFISVVEICETLYKSKYNLVKWKNGSLQRTLLFPSFFLVFLRKYEQQKNTCNIIIMMSLLCLLKRVFFCSCFLSDKGCAGYDSTPLRCTNDCKRFSLTYFHSLCSGTLCCGTFSAYNCSLWK